MENSRAHGWPLKFSLRNYVIVRKWVERLHRVDTKDCFICIVRFPWSLFNVWGVCLAICTIISGFTSLSQWISLRETVLAIYILLVAIDIHYISSKLIVYSLFGCYWCVLELFPLQWQWLEWNVLYTWIGRSCLLILFGFLQLTSSIFSFIIGCLVISMGLCCMLISLLSLRYDHFSPERMTTLFHSTMEEQPEYIPPPPSDF
eukprot:jgi/Galph1/5418/GphlegSOOS_G4031.1